MKKGQAQFIGWVLLIGFAVMISALVGNWVLEQARETSEGVIEMTTKDMRCADVSVSISCETELNQFKVINTGYFTIKKLACYNVDNYELIGFEAKPKESKSFSINLCTSIVPIIEIDSKELGCSEKQVEVKCNE